MRKFLLLTLLTASLFGCGGCFGSSPEAVIDYSTKPQDFIMRFELNKDYLIKRHGEEFHFQVKTGFLNADKIKIIWNKVILIGLTEMGTTLWIAVDEVEMATH